MNNPFVKTETVDSITSGFTSAANKLSALITTLDDTIVRSITEIEKHEDMIEAAQTEKVRALEVLYNINKLISKE